MMYMTSIYSDYYTKFRTTYPLCIKGKPISVQAWSGPEACTKLSLPDFKTIGT